MHQDGSQKQFLRHTARKLGRAWIANVVLLCGYAENWFLVPQGFCWFWNFRTGMELSEYMSDLQNKQIYSILMLTFFFLF